MTINRLTLQLEEIKTAFATEPNPTLAVRLDRIHRIEKMLMANEEKICKAISADFGIRHPNETRVAELNLIYQACKHVRKNLKEWLKPRYIATPSYLGASTAWITPQAKGVVGIISPWNYPIQLALIPAISAFAGGNRVWLKPSEKSKRTSGFLAALIQEYFHPSEFCVINGGTDIAEDFAALPFDHLFFTGSPLTGKKVMKAASDNLTPVTLELGGKSPAIVDPSADLKETAGCIIFGKLLNGGQTCIAPDYILINSADLIPFVEQLQIAAQSQFSLPQELTGPLHNAPLERWHGLLQDAINKGANAIPLLKDVTNESRIFNPVVLTNVSIEALIMEEEIFGPILPIFAISNVTDAVKFINQLPNPLALYWFGKNKTNLQQVLNETRSGGVTINETLLHATQESLPFGGIGSSGMGAYHGKFGFDTFTHQKPILNVRSRFGLGFLKGTKTVRPPYKNKKY